MSIKIVKPAVVTTLVSDGREGFRSLGIGPGGAMDYFAMKTANFLVGNDREAVLEMGYSSVEILFHEGGLISITGKGFDAFVNDEVATMWRPFKIKPNARLIFKKKSKGAWIYLAIHGGWKAQEWLHSFTTNLHAETGGFNGRTLQKGDILERNKTEVIATDERSMPWGISTNELSEVYSSPDIIRCISSAETDLMHGTSKEKFVSSGFTLTSQCNRMGYRLTGDPLFLGEKVELVSSPVDFGTVQLLPDGNPIVLMADHQTTGGYPRIASVVKADLCKLSQKMPGDKINFKMIPFQEAEEGLVSREQKLKEIKESCHLRIKKHFRQ
ncbi:MAG TPA: biotin-dependent carboxyltransferase family protein [Cyclobacteriaceae bacterium]|jgi:antagonist of KipI|nr:biotin-dependent carboxyltransferase family protein [Cyclobacteriaceae bacterium]